MQCGVAPVGRTGLAEPFRLTRYEPVPATLRFASLSFTTRSTDAPASTHIPGLLAPLELRRGLSRGQDGRWDGLMEQAAADLVLDNTDGGLDGLPDAYVFRDRPVSIRAARTTRQEDGREAVPALAEFASLFEGRAADIRLDRDRLVIRLHDRLRRLERLVQQEVYQGHGGRNGGPELAGQRPPLCYGRCFNIKPVLVDALRGIYQVHDGEVKRISVVRDRGVPLVLARDVGSFAELEALVTEGESDPEEGGWDLGRGEVATCRREGFFRLGGAAAGTITADVEGDGIKDGPVPFDNGVLFDGGVGFDQLGDRVHSRYAGGIIYRLLVTRLGFAPAEVDVDRLAQFDAENPFEVSLFVGPGDAVTGRDAVRRLAESAGGVLVWTRQGQASLAPLTGPAPGAVREIGPDRIARDGIDIVPLAYGAPWGVVRIRRSRNWSPLQEDELAADVTGADRAALTSPGAFAERRDARLDALFPDRAPLELDSLLVDDAAAQAVAARLQALYAPGRTLFRVQALGLGFRLDCLDTVTLRHGRYGLAAGRRVVVVEVTERPGQHRTDLLLFG